jgi:plasmid maintenance system antidote protein VapI
MTNSTINEEFGRYISPAAAARIIGVSKQSIANLIRRGYFKTKAAAGRVLILRSEAEAFVPRPKGRPAKDAKGKRALNAKPPEILNMKPAKQYVSQAEAARIRSVSQQAIANLIRRGRLEAVTVAGRTLVLRSEVEAFVAKPKPGRPPKKAASRKASKRGQPMK